MMTAYALGVGKWVMALGAALLVSAMLTGVAYAINYTIRKLLDCYGGWKVFLQYREWYHNERKEKP